MENYTREAILRMAEEEDVEFIRLQFTDMFGTLKNIAIPSTKLEKAMDNRCVIDASSIGGSIRDEEVDMYLHPDLSTFTILPWRPQQGKVARFICDIYQEDGTAYKESPRFILDQVVAKAVSAGYTLMVNPECEFFLFHTDDNGMPTTTTHEKAGYMDLSPVDLGENARRDMVLTLEEMGYEIESSHHEIAPGQQEIDFQFSDVRETADKVMTFKVAVRTIAKRHGLHATFMPKPKAGVNGSGMHINMYLMKDGKNILSDAEDEIGLSKEGYSFMAGILAHIKGMTAVCNPLVNSYKRLAPGFEAPSDITWSTKQRTALVRVQTQREEGARLELRSPDSASNPYLVFALCLAAGLDGIEKNMRITKELKENIRRFSKEEKKQAGIDTLPENLSEALDEFAKDPLIKAVLGETFVNCYLKAKQKEWERYMEQVSEWEIEQYLYRV
ncbi:type I glutamate--ammonia ligase [Kineothrix sp. MB12-C1]|uniref:type I glutamate--ammonia ligase n=1 Tax=Kineothrix sp. MB12-C1 TaxID=3070215 RepID=UPI0027D2EEC6|nr:type I glutamate--ammonia ligase [Kineothrix sp. MB12-C1]WMC93354.1 type I glutamate--ammonia ligase [Kineothrix sp. MB12-C1]